MTIFWAGDSESYALVVDARAKVDHMLAQSGTMKAGWLDEMLAKLPPIWRHEGSVAVVEINGPVVQGKAGFMRLFGVLGYDDIGAAAVEAATHADTAKMLYHINSPGGDVAGIMDMGTLLAQLSHLKPSAVYTTELMASAGYWMATAIKGHISAGPTAIVGSIGVLRVHTEYSKANEQRGVTTTVLRAGEYKAEMNSVEPLTEGAKERAEAMMAEVHGLFRAQVAKGRPNLDKEKLAEVTKGQVFLGQSAVKAGLVDKVQSFELALKLLDKQKHPSNTSNIPKGNKAMVLTPEQLNALLAGATMASLGLNADGSVMSAEELTARDAATAQDGVKAELATVKAELETTKAALAAAQAGTGDVVSVKAELATAKVKIGDLEKVAQHHDGLLAIARSATAKMLVPMGGTKAAVEGLDAAGIVAEHARVEPLFLEKFKPGQQHQASEDDNKQKDKKADVPFGFLLAVKNVPSATR